TIFRAHGSFRSGIRPPPSGGSGSHRRLTLPRGAPRPRKPSRSVSWASVRRIGIPLPIVFASCGPATVAGPHGPAASTSRSGAQTIQDFSHVVMIVMENREYNVV